MVTRTKNQNTYIHGSWNVICDRCGFKFKQEDIKKQWDGLEVCVDCWEIRHEQDFLKGVKDDPSVPFTRPDAEDATTIFPGDADANLTWTRTALTIYEWDTPLTASRTALIQTTDEAEVNGATFTIYKTATSGASNTLDVQRPDTSSIREIAGDIEAVLIVVYNGNTWEEVSFTTIVF